MREEVDELKVEDASLPLLRSVPIVEPEARENARS
jgi:hypothetical protein